MVQEGMEAAMLVRVRLDAEGGPAAEVAPRTRVSNAMCGRIARRGPKSPQRSLREAQWMVSERSRKIPAKPKETSRRGEKERSEQEGVREQATDDNGEAPQDVAALVQVRRKACQSCQHWDCLNRCIRL